MSLQGWEHFRSAPASYLILVTELQCQCTVSKWPLYLISLTQDTNYKQEHLGSRTSVTPLFHSYCAVRWRWGWSSHIFSRGVSIQPPAVIHCNVRFLPNMMGLTARKSKLSYYIWYREWTLLTRVGFIWFILKGLPWWHTRGKEHAFQCRRHKRCRFNAWVGKIPWRRAWQPTPVFLPEKSHG